MAAVAIPQSPSAQAPRRARISDPARKGLPAPALLVAVCFASGVAVAQIRWIAPGPLLAGIALLIFAAIVASVREPRLALASTSLVCMLPGLFCAEVQPRPVPITPLMRIADATPTPTPALHHQGIRTAHEIQGRVVRTTPLRLAESFAPYSDKIRQEHSQQIDIRVDTVDGAPLRTPEGLRLTVFAPVAARFPALDCDSAFRGPVEIHTEERFLDPGVWDARAWLRQQGISVLGSAHADQVTVSAANRHPSFACVLHALQQDASTRLIAFPDRPVPRWLPRFARLAPDDAAMLTAMLTGDRTHLGHRLRVGFERTGSFHLLVVSGLHLAIFAGLVFRIARLVRLPRVAASLATVGLSLAYALFTGFGQPVQRAFWMIALYLVGRLLWRERHPLNAIGFAALVLLAANPSALLDAGFQMTLLSVLAVAGIASPLAERTFGPYVRAPRNLALLAIDPSLPPRVAQFRVTLRLLAERLRPLTGRLLSQKLLPWFAGRALLALEVLATSLAIEALMFLPMALYFHRVTVLALPVNVFIVPLLTVLLPLALTTMAAVLILPQVAVAPAAVLALVLHSVSGLVQHFGAMRSGDLRIPAPSTSLIAAAILLSAAALALIRMPRFAISASAAALALAAALTVLPHPATHRPGALEISTIDVGQGDSILVITPNGRTLLIDAGGLVGASGPNVAESRGSTSNFDIGEDVVSPVLWSRGIRRLDAIAITHAHADHIGGIPAVLADFRPRELWIGINPHSAAYDAILAEARDAGIRVLRHTAGDQFTFDDVLVRVLAPDAGYRPAAAPGNNDSLVLQMRYGRTTALLEGDAEEPSEQRMLALGGLHSDFLKVGHHGSRTSTTPEFLSAVAPRFAAISVGHRNFYGHPRHEVLTQLEDARVRTFRTDVLGLSTFYLDGTTVKAAAWTDR